MKSTLPRLLGSLGAFIGLIIFLVGLLGLILFLFADHPSIAQVVESINLPMPPVWFSLAMMLTGLLSYIWGQGLLLKKDWSPYFAAVYLFHLGLYGSLALWLLIPTRLMASMLAPLGLQEGSQTAIIIQAGLLLLPLAVGYLFAHLLLRSPGIIAPYAQKYQKESAALRICSNQLCRSLLPANGLCPYCQPQEIWAVLEPEGDDTRQYPMRFQPQRQEWTLTRRADSEQHAPQTVYFNMLRNASYAFISRPHARIEYRVEERSGSAGFYVVDLKSANGTYVIRGEEEYPGDNTLLQNGDELMLGTARFLFRAETPSVSTAPVQQQTGGNVP